VFIRKGTARNFNRNNKEELVMESKSISRGRPVEPEVQERRLLEEAEKVREIESRLAEVNLRHFAGIDTALRLVRRLEKHLASALKARVLLTENR
jgi:hypothetical protein